MVSATKFRRLSRRERNLFLEASILLSLSTLSIKAIPFKYIDRFLRSCFSDSISDGIDVKREIALVRRSISRAANALPWKSLCLSRSIAEFIMLRGRGIPAVILVGARFSGESRLDAHAWVETGLEVKDKRSENSGFATVIRIGTGPVSR